MEFILPADPLVTGVLLICVGLFIGVFSGLLGIGGGTVMVPVLRLIFGLSAYAATATSLFAIIPTSLSGAATHLRNKTCVPKLGLVLGLGGAVTSALGVYLGSISPSWAIMLVAAVIILYSAYNMLKKALKIPSGKAAASDRAAGVAGRPATAGAASAGAAAVPVTAEAPEESKPVFVLGRRELVGGVLIGLVAGLASGYVGVGGGFIMVPLMTSWLGVPMRYASGTSLIAIIILCVPGVAEQMTLGNVDYFAGILLVLGSIPGAAVGAKLVKKVPERTLRFIFAGFLGVAAVMLLVKEAGLLG
ncbi:MAG: sulfite exporter TauE/SafE family protein [Eggerthellales bacterium]|nr:sulfite exporter TauE/SafE family protein [Eggerthellales bacterium]